MARLATLRLVAVLGAVHCGDAPLDGPVGHGASRASSDPAARPDGDALLAAARASIADGRIDAQHVADIQASADPVHARAQRLLPVLATPVAALAPPAADAEAGAPPLRAPPLPDAPGDPQPVPPAEARADMDTPASPTPTPTRDPTPTASTERVVSGLGLSATKHGATLTIRGTGKLMVGTANQLSTGVVHLVVDRAKATGAAIAARPRIEGAEVTAVRKGQGTVQITVTLAPGWSLGPIRSFSGGTRVTFVHTS